MNLAFFASHRGSNMQSVLDACHDGRLRSRPVLLICNNRGAEALDRATRAGFPGVVLNGVTHPDPDALDRAMVEALTSHGAELVLLAGYMKKIGPKVLSAYPGRILNIHPALLPDFGGGGMYGSRVHQAVIASGARESGASVHLVDAEYDHGRVLTQARVPVMPGDTAETLAARVLVEEHKLYVTTLQQIEAGSLKI